MIVTQEIARIAQALLKDSTASLVEATWQSLTPLKLTPGQSVQGEVLASLPQSRFLVRVANELLKMELPLNLQPGQAVELTYVTDEPRLLFALSKNANSGIPVQISDTGRWLNSLAQEAKTPPAATPLPRPALILSGPPRDPAALADGLRNALTKSGVFYESHLADWLRGERPLADILREPQGTLSRLAASLPAETGSPAPTPAQGQPQTPGQSQTPVPGQHETAARQAAPPATGAPPAGTGEEPAAPQAPAPSATPPREAAPRERAPQPGAAPLPREGGTPPESPSAQNPPSSATATAGKEAPSSAQTSGGSGAAPRPESGAPPSSSPPAAPATPEPAAQRPAEIPSPAVPQGKAAEPPPPLNHPAPAAGSSVPETAVRHEAPAPASPGTVKADTPPPAPESTAASADPRAASPEARDIRTPLQPEGARPAAPQRPSPATAPLPAETPTAPAGARVEAAAVDKGAIMRPASLPPQGGVEPQTIPIIKEQLAALTSGSFTWLGQVWPGQDMEWTVQEREAEEKGQERKWQTELRIEFPRLGKVRATLMLAGEGVAVNLVTADEETAAVLTKGSGRLVEHMEGAGIRLSGLAVRHGGD